MPNQSARKMRKNILIFVITVLIISIPFILLSLKGLGLFYQLLRSTSGVNLNSIPQSTCLKVTPSSQSEKTDAGGLFILFKGKVENTCSIPVMNPSPRVVVYRSNTQDQINIKPVLLPNIFSFQEVIKPGVSVPYEFTLKILKADVKEGAQYTIIFYEAAKK